MQPVPPNPWLRLPAELAVAMRPALPAAVEGAVAAVTAAVAPATTGTPDPKFERDARAAVQAGFGRFLDLIGTDEPALPPRVREVFLALGAAEARENRGPEVLLAALRTASRMMLRTASGSLARIRPMAVDELVDLAEAISAYVDELATATTDGYARQLREQAGEGDRRRRQLAESLLRGGTPRSVMVDEATGIGWRTLDAVVPVLLPVDQARDARFRYGADGVVAERERDAVLLLRAGPRATRSQLVDTLAGRGAVVGPRLHWAQVPEAVRLAEHTAELVRGLTGDRTDPVFTDDHLGTLALRGVPGALAMLSTHRLAPLARLRAGQRENLLLTLHSWLRHWGSRTAVSAELYVHPQTVSYRLGRLRELFGGDLDDPAVRFELLIVLTAQAEPVVPVSAPGARGSPRHGRPAIGS